MAFGRGGKGAFVIDDESGTPVDISLFIDSVTWGDFTTDTLETTGFGPQRARTYAAGLTTGVASITGKFDAVTGGPDEILQALRGMDPFTIEWQPEGAGLGKPFKRAEAILTGYSASAPVGEIITFSASFQISGDETVGSLAA